MNLEAIAVGHCSRTVTVKFLYRFKVGINCEGTPPGDSQSKKSPTTIVLGWNKTKRAVDS